MVAWVLNLDAEQELASPARYRGPKPEIDQRIRALHPKLAGLVRPGDVIVEEATDARGMIGDAWCMTPRARERLVRAGARPVRAPPLEVLRRVNDRRFAAELGQTLHGARFALRADDVKRAITTNGTWLLKRSFGFAGRGRRKVTGRAFTANDIAWISASLREGRGLQVEPYVDRALDVALHGFLFEDGRVRWGEITVQECDESGAWIASRLAGGGKLRREERATLLATAEASARALHAAGYFGPFGVDGYRWSGGFNPRSEINARYSMGWSVGMGGFRPYDHSSDQSETT